MLSAGADDVSEGGPDAGMMEHGIAYETAYYNRFGADEFRQRVHDEPLVMQGPTGSVLMAAYGAADIPPAFWNVAEPQTVVNLHELYVAAGAQILITNTFQASAPVLERDGIRASMGEVNRAAVDAARAAHPQLLAGSIGACGIDWMRVDSPAYRAARAAYRDQAHALLSAGVDLLLLETFTSIRELEPALAGVNDIRDGMPVAVSFAVGAGACLLGDHLNMEGAVVYAEQHGADAVGVNCCSINDADACIASLLRAARTPVMVRPNAGAPARDADGSLAWEEDPAAYARAARRWAAAGVQMVGACCGTTAATTAAIADALEDVVSARA